jgi:hypothetical protein
MFKVSAEVAEPTKATLPELNDQLAPLPFKLPASVTSPGASMDSAPPELRVEPETAVIVALAGVAESLGAPTPVLGMHAVERHTTGSDKSETASKAPCGSNDCCGEAVVDSDAVVNIAVLGAGSVDRGVPLFPEVDNSEAA